MIILNEFITNLKIIKAHTQICVIDLISIYVNDIMIYKVIVAINLLYMKKARKLGIEVQYKTIFFDMVAIDLNELKKKCRKGMFIIMYYLNEKNNELNVYEREVDKSTQMSKLKQARIDRE